MKRFAKKLLLICSFAVFLPCVDGAEIPIVVETNLSLRVMAANLTSGSNQAYEGPGLRILQGLKPDIVAIQEFNYSNNSPAAFRAMVDLAFGKEFTWFRESGATYSIPNGIISRFPILSSGSWEDVDAGVNDRGFAWARIDIPGTNDLYVVSVHLKASSGSDNAARRFAEVTNLVNLVTSNFPPQAWTIIAGDCNIYDPSELAYQHLANRFSDNPIPTDAETGGDPDTNLGRSERYDYVFPSQGLAVRLVPTVVGSRTFSKGLVFDSRIYVPLSDVAPVLASDSSATGMQHMGVVRSFNVPYSVTNYATPPTLFTQPPSLSAAQGERVSLTVTAAGSPPLAYQWRFNSADLAGASTATLVLTNFQPVQAGRYSVLVTNMAGTAASAEAILSLTIPPPQFTFSKDGTLSWRGLSNVVYTVELKTNLADAAWVLLGTTSSPDGWLSFTNAATGPRAFHRVSARH